MTRSEYALIHEWIQDVRGERREPEKEVPRTTEPKEDVPIYMQASRVVESVREYEFPLREPDVKLELVEERVEESVHHYPLRDPLFALLFLCALGYLVYLTADGVSRGHVDELYAFALKMPPIYEYPWLDSALVVARRYVGAEMFSVLFSVPLSLVTLALLYVSGRAVTGVCVVVSLLGAAALLVYVGVETRDPNLWALCGVAGVFLLAAAYAVVVHWRQIIFTGALLEYASGALLHALPAFAVTSLLVGALYVVFVGWWLLTLSSLLTTTLVVRDGVEVVGGAAFAVYFTVFMFLWVSQVTRGVVQMMVASATAKWFHGERSARRMFHAAASATLRAVTVSLGSLALGALLVAAVELAFLLLKRVKRVAKKMYLRPLVWLLQSALLAVRAFVRFVNNYAYIEMALHGTSFFASSHRAYARFRENAYEMLTSHLVTWYTVSALRLSIALASALLGVAMSASAGEETSHWTLSVSVSISYACAALLTQWLETATYTVLVCYVDDRERAPAHIREALYWVSPD